MDSWRLEQIPIPLDLETLGKTLRVKGSGPLEALQRMAEQARAVANPKVVYRAAFIEAKGDDQVIIDGLAFTSRVLRVNLDRVHRVFPYVATCGLELDEWSASFDDLLDKYWADMIKEAAVRAAREHGNRHLLAQYGLEKVVRMNPGSLPDWPLSEQKGLFALLGEGPASIGVRLNESFLMTPIKSVSGIWFPAEQSYENCQLCPREECPGRRAPYDRELYERKYQQKDKFEILISKFETDSN